MPADESRDDLDIRGCVSRMKDLLDSANAGERNTTHAIRIASAQCAVILWRLERADVTRRPEADEPGSYPRLKVS